MYLRYILFQLYFLLLFRQRFDFFCGFRKLVMLCPRSMSLRIQLAFQKFSTSIVINNFKFLFHFLTKLLKLTKLSLFIQNWVSYINWKNKICKFKTCNTVYPNIFIMILVLLSISHCKNYNMLKLCLALFAIRNFLNHNQFLTQKIKEVIN